MTLNSPTGLDEHSTSRVWDEQREERLDIRKVLTDNRCWAFRRKRSSPLLSCLTDESQPLLLGDR